MKRETAVFACCLPLLLIGLRAGGAGLEGAEFRKETVPDSGRIEFGIDGEPRGLVLVARHQDAENYVAVRLNGRDVQIAEAVKGTERVLASGSGAGAAGTVFLAPGSIRVESGSCVAGAMTRAGPGGQYGAAPGTGGRLVRLVLRPEEALYRTDDFMRAEGTGEQWRPAGGKWSIRAERDVERSSNPFRCIARSPEPALLVTGEPWWHDYSASVSVCGRSGAAGLAFGVRDTKNYHLFRLGVGAGKSELVRVEDGKETILVSVDSALYRDRWYRLAVRSDVEGVVASVDGQPFLHSPALAPSGGVGLYVREAAETMFDDVLVASAHLPGRDMAPIELFSKVFESDEQMENWASLWGAWRPRPMASTPGRRPPAAYWHKGDFFGDVSIACRPVLDRDRRGVVGLVVGGSEESGQGADLVVRAEGELAVWTLSLAGKELCSAKGPMPDRAVVSLAWERGTLRACGTLVARADSTAVLKSPCDDLPGRSLGLWADGARVDLHAVEIRSANVYDYLFEEAPCEWFARTGTWQITNRWMCDPRWSWLGGESRLTAQMWSKRAFHGDQTVEFFAAFKMRGPSAAAGYPHVGDINLTICGDGRNLDSGYQVIFAGWGNRWTRLLRNGAIVAGSGDCNIEGNFHRRWFHVKARRTGDIVQLYIDDELIRAYRDPKPLDGGQVALWTFDNGIMISRVRVYAERSEVRTFLKTAPDRAAPAAPDGQKAPDGYVALYDFKENAGRCATRDGEQGARLELAPGGGLLLVKDNAGGSFGVTLYDRPFDALRYPVVSLGWKVVSAEPVCVNLFAEVNGELYEVPLAAPASPAAAETLSGGPKAAFHGPRSGEARRVDIDLGALLSNWYQEKYGRKPVGLTVSNLHLANASNEKYLLCGFGGNRAGAAFCLTEFAIRTRAPAP